MAHIWTRSDDAWHPADLPSGGCALGGVLWVRRVPGDEDAWALLAAPCARLLLNGLPLSHGLAILSDRDEIRFVATGDSKSQEAAPFYFSTERLAAIAPYLPTGRRGVCPRCKQSMTPGESAVRCPGCGLWHHATDALPCWTYSEHCAACDQPTSLEASFQWTPEDLQ